MPESKGKILFLCPQPFFEWRGSPIRVGFDVRALAELGYEVDLLTLPIGQPCEIRGVSMSRVGNPLGIRRVSIGPSAAKAFFDLLIWGRGVRMCRRTHYDFIHGVEEAAALGVALRRIAGSSLVYEKHSDPSSHRQGFLRNRVMDAYQAVEKFTARRAAAIIGTGPGLVDQVRGWQVRGSVHHIPDIPSSLAEATDEATGAARREWADAGGDSIITYVGSFAVYQGIDLLFEAIPIVAKRAPTARFVIVGGSVSEIEQRKSELRAAGAEKAVRFAGHIPPDRLPAYLAASDILLSPRISGVNTPLKLLDYLKVARPIVATDSEANRLILNKQLAVLTDMTPQGYAQGILDVLNNPQKGATLAARGRQLIDTTYNFEAFKRGLGVCYDSIRNEGRS